jgi:hypothetical protein
MVSCWRKGSDKKSFPLAVMDRFRKRNSSSGKRVPLKRELYAILSREAKGGIGSFRKERVAA